MLLVAHASLLQVAQKMAEIKQAMSTLLCNFNKSGDLANDLDDHSRDLLFFQNFAKSDPMWFWIYMAWNHGRNLPAWNVALLPESESFDFGVTDSGDTSPPPPQPKQQKRKRAAEVPVTAAPDSELSTLISMSNKWMELAMKSQSSAQSSATTNSQPLDAEEARTDSMRFLTAQLKHLQDSLALLPQSLHPDVHDAIEQVRRDACCVLRDA